MSVVFLCSGGKGGGGGNGRGWLRSEWYEDFNITFYCVYKRIMI